MPSARSPRDRAAPKERLTRTTFIHDAGHSSMTAPDDPSPTKKAIPSHAQMRADPLLKFLGIGLDPTEDRCVVDLDAAVEEHQFEIPVADGKRQIPTNGPQDHLSGELPPREAVAPIHLPRRALSNRGPYTGNPSTG